MIQRSFDMGRVIDQGRKAAAFSQEEEEEKEEEDSRRVLALTPASHESKWPSPSGGTGTSSIRTEAKTALPFGP